MGFPDNLAKILDGWPDYRFQNFRKHFLSYKLTARVLVVEIKAHLLAHDIVATSAKQDKAGFETPNRIHGLLQIYWAQVQDVVQPADHLVFAAEDHVFQGIARLGVFIYAVAHPPEMVYNV